MVSWSAQEYKNYVARRYANLHTDHTRQAAKLESGVGDASNEAGSVKASNPARFLVSIKAARKRLLDPDGAVPKFHIDCLRYCGAIPNDSSKEIELRVTQRKCRKSEAEHVTIEVCAI